MLCSTDDEELDVDFPRGHVSFVGRASEEEKEVRTRIFHTCTFLCFFQVFLPLHGEVEVLVESVGSTVGISVGQCFFSAPKAVEVLPLASLSLPVDFLNGLEVYEVYLVH